jgi:hypothetical protein
MDPERVPEWARDHLSKEPPTGLQALIEESKEPRLSFPGFPIWMVFKSVVSR